MENSMLWRSATSTHDWNDGTFVRGLLNNARDLGLIGPVTRVKIGIRGRTKKLPLAQANELFDRLEDPLPDEPEQRYLEAEGISPVPWKVIISIAPWDQPEGEPTGPSYIWLFLPRSAFTASVSSKVAQAFQRLHRPENTEYAFVHDYQHWLTFTDEHYSLPVTTGPMFTGAFWLNFLGPGHVEEFRLPHLKKSLTLASMSELIEKPARACGVYWQSFVDPQNTATPASERALVALTQAFRTALRPTSKWFSKLKSTGRSQRSSD